MKIKLTWKKGFFDTTYQLYSGNEKVGELHENALKQIATGFLNNKKYRFETRGILNQSTAIVDVDTEYEIGAITYNAWHTKATISIFGHAYYWKFNNIWNTQWSLFDFGKLIINSEGTSTQGNIEFEDVEEPLLLSGLFVHNYYIQYAAVFAALIPIFVVLFT
jgi:hypothetical protein